MLLILIPIAWLALVTLFIAICLAAARGDAAQRRIDDEVFEAVEDGVGAVERDAGQPRTSWRSPARGRHPAWVARAGAVRAFHFASSGREARHARVVGPPRRPD
jgi:hypothetical protein